jgi:hypothetical protein
MDEHTKAETSGRTWKWVLQGGAAGGVILVGSVLLASFSPIGAVAVEPSAEAGVHDHAHRRPDVMRPRLAMGEGRDMGSMGFMGEGRDRGAMGEGRDRGAMGEGRDMGSMGARRAARMGAALGGRVAEFLEMDRQELGEAVRGGASIAELAGDRVDGLVADLVARATERIEQAVADGRLDPERADGILARVEERITARLHEERPTGPAGS